MKKSLIGLAVLSTFAGAASAQTSLSIYGLVDAGIVYEKGVGPNDDSVVKLTSGVQNGSRLGFKGTEDLGRGLTAKFVLESGFNIDTGASGQSTPGQTSLLFGRQAYIGLGGNWGNVTFGRQYTPHYLALAEADPFGAGLAGDIRNLFPTVQRMDNTIKYTTPTWSGFVGELAYGFGEVPGDNTASRQAGAAIGYANGPLLVKVSYHRADGPIADATYPGGVLLNDNTRNTLLTAKWDFGVAAASLGYGTNKGGARTTINDTRDWMLGVTVPVGAGTILASYIRADDRGPTSADAHQWAIGYTHAVSKRTNFYTSYGQISNDNAAAYTVGNATERGTGDKAFNVGVRHLF